MGWSCGTCGDPSNRPCLNPGCGPLVWKEDPPRHRRKGENFMRALGWTSLMTGLVMLWGLPGYFITLGAFLIVAYPWRRDAP